MGMSITTEALLRRESILLIWQLRALWLAIVFYLLSSFHYFIWMFSPVDKIGKRASRLLFTGVLIHAAIIALRMVEGGQLLCLTSFESMLWFAWSAAIIYLVVERIFRDVFAAGFPVAAIIGAACFYTATRLNPVIVQPFPVFQRGWFTWHVLATFFSYALFVVAFSVEIGYVVLARLLPSRMLSKYGMDADMTARFHRMAHQVILFGFPLLTFGIISRAAWTEQLWGRYWSWNPEETLSLITWMVYALYLHAMTMSKWRGGRASVLNMLGFVCTLMTFLGVGWIAKLLGIPGLNTISL